MPNINTLSSGNEDTTYSVFTIGALKLAIDRQSIHSIETILDMKPLDSETASDAIATIHFNTQIIPVFALNEELSIVSTLPETRRACLLFKSENNQPYGIAVDTITALDTKTHESQAIPACMLTEQSPVINVLREDDNFIGILNSQLLKELLNTDLFYSDQIPTNELTGVSHA